MSDKEESGGSDKPAKENDKKPEPPPVKQARNADERKAAFRARQRRITQEEQEQQMRQNAPGLHAFLQAHSNPYRPFALTPEVMAQLEVDYKEAHKEGKGGPMIDRQGSSHSFGHSEDIKHTSEQDLTKAAAGPSLDRQGSTHSFGHGEAIAHTSQQDLTEAADEEKPPAKLPRKETKPEKAIKSRKEKKPAAGTAK